jgi:hypothetical protein
MGVSGWGGAVTLYVEADLSRPVTFAGPPPPPSGLTQWDEDVFGSTPHVVGETAVFSGYDPEWTDISEWVLGVQTSHAFSRQTNRYNTGTASVLLSNVDGRFSPTNTDSPYRSGSSTTIGILRQIRIRATYTEGSQTFSWVLFRGYIQSWDQKFPDFGYNSTVEVQAVGLESRLASWDGYAVTPVGAGELSGARVARILDAAGWDGPRNIDAGTAALQETTLEGSATTQVQLVADSEGGFFYFTPDGTATFDSIDAQVLKGRLNSYVTISDVAADATTQTIRYQDIAYSYNGDLVSNIVNYQRVGGTVQTVIAGASRNMYGDRQVSRTDLINTSDSDVLNLAQRQIAVFQSPELRVESVVISAITPDNAEFITGTPGGAVFRALATGKIALRSGAQVVQTPRHESDQIAQMCFIEAVSHNITPDSWTVGLNFSSAAAYSNVGIAVFDGTDAQAGFFDLTRWGW